MTWKKTFAFVVVTLAISMIGHLNAAESVPGNWLIEWQSPSATMRPLQIIHGRTLPDVKSAEYYRKDCGLGGLVVNVGGPEYIRSPKNWSNFVLTVQNIEKAGLRFWVYDEEGYPSLAAGGVVLEGHPELVSKEMVYDAGANPEFYVRDCYEFTHSCNNYFRARRYPNPLEPAAVERFLEVTHARYKKELGDRLYCRMEAFFTDEPSIMSVNLGLIPEENRKKVVTIDPLDPAKKNLQMIPWCSDMEERYRAKYGEELKPRLKSLFTGDSEADKAVRFRFWQLVTELNVNRFYGAIDRFCKATPTGPVSSGHTLAEEGLTRHVALDGNKISTLKKLALPGLDVLNSDPLAHQYGGWKTAAFPCSAATLINQRRVMTEVSDHAQRNSGDKKPALLPLMEATAAWQAAWGVTEFTLYYQINVGTGDAVRNEATHKKYCDFIGRLNSVLREATPNRALLLYYPIETLQSEFLPPVGVLQTATQSKKFQETVRSFDEIGLALCRAQIPFTIIDTESILSLSKEDLAKFTGILYPLHSAPSKEVTGKLEKCLGKSNDKFGLFAETEKKITSAATIASVADELAGPHLRTAPAGENLFCGTFERDGRTIYMIVNLGKDAYEGTATLAGVNHPVIKKDDKWSAMNPSDGTIAEVKPIESKAAGVFALPVKLRPRETTLLVSP